MNRVGDGRRRMRTGTTLVVAAGALLLVPPATAVPTARELAESVEPLTGPVDPIGGAGAIVPMSERTRDGTERLSTDVLFDFDRATLRPAGRGQVLRLARTAGRRTGTLRVVGHTDGLGEDGYNRRLSRRRAQAVARVLRRALPGAVRVETVGRGSADPVVPETTSEGDDDPAARARNRRVELRWARP
jgi:outer membrane protein OmpA-like peptidoglycan-associated protein